MSVFLQPKKQRKKRSCRKKVEIKSHKEFTLSAKDLRKILCSSRSPKNSSASLQGSTNPAQGDKYSQAQQRPSELKQPIKTKIITLKVSKSINPVSTKLSPPSQRVCSTSVHPSSNILQVDGHLSGSDTENDESEKNEKFKCEFCNKQYSTKINLQKHLRLSCKLKPVEMSDKPRRAQCESKTYHCDKTLEPYVNTCSNDYAKFMCCENEQYPITIKNFWPCLFDYRSRSDLTPLLQDVCAHNSYEVLSSILIDAHNHYDIHSITFAQHAFVERGSESFDISQYRIPKFWQNKVLNNRPTFQVQVSDGLVTISLSEQYLALIPAPLYLPHDSLCTSTDDNDSAEIELSQQLSQVSLQSSESDFERPVKIARYSTDHYLPRQIQQSCEDLFLRGLEHL